MTKDELIRIVNEFTLENGGVELYLLGTGNLLLQGVDVVPNDIDFIASKEAVKSIADKYGSKIAENDTGYIEAEINYKGNEIHIVSSEGNPLRECDIEKHSTFINLGEFNIKGLSLESERIFYQKAGREKDINKIVLIDKVFKKLI